MASPSAQRQWPLKRSPRREFMTQWHWLPPVLCQQHGTVRRVQKYRLPTLCSLSIVAGELLMAWAAGGLDLAYITVPILQPWAALWLRGQCMTQLRSVAPGHQRGQTLMYQHSHCMDSCVNTMSTELLLWHQGAAIGQRFSLLTLTAFYWLLDILLPFSQQSPQQRKKELPQESAFPFLWSWVSSHTTAVFQVCSWSWSSNKDS